MVSQLSSYHLLCRSLYNYTVWGNSFIRYFFCPFLSNLSFWNSNYVYFYVFTLWCFTGLWGFVHFSLLFFFFLFFRSDSLQWSIFKFVDSLSVQICYWAPLKNFTFNSRISTWLFLQFPSLIDILYLVNHCYHTFL